MLNILSSLPLTKSLMWGDDLRISPPLTLPPLARFIIVRDSRRRAICLDVTTPKRRYMA